jgi:carbonic anhydrase
MKMEHPEETAARREETAARREETAVNGQGPFAIVLGCSDSRVPVEAIFDRGIGDIFTVRVAGNVAIDSSVIGSLEYGAGHLRVPLLVILGHTQCGAVAAAVSGAKLEGGLVEVQKAIEPSVKEVKMQYPDLKETALTNEAVKQNVFQVERDLRAYSPQIQAMVAQGSLKIALAAYDLRTGKVEWLEEI